MDDKIIDRIKEVMDMKQLTSTFFADKIKVNRASISHILSGRNRPSLDIIIKILDTFPDLDSDWLLRDKKSISPPPPIVQQEKNDLFSQSKNIITETLVQKDKKNKEIEKITVFFTDGTFKDFK